MVASGDANGNIIIWNVHNGIYLNIIQAHTNKVLSVAFNHDSTKIVSGSADGSIRIWEETGTCLHKLNFGNPVWMVSFNYDGTKILSFGYDGAKIWNTKTGTSLYELLDTGMTAVSFNHDGTLIVSGSDDRSITEWYAETGGFLVKLDTIYPNSIGFNSDSTKMILLDTTSNHKKNDISISIWNLKDLTSHEIQIGSSPKTVIKKKPNNVSFNKDCDMSEKDLYDMIKHSNKRKGNYTYKTQDAEIKVKLWKSKDAIKAKLMSYTLDNIIFKDSNTQLLHIIYDISLQQIEIKYVYIGSGK